MAMAPSVASPVEALFEGSEPSELDCWVGLGASFDCVTGHLAVQLLDSAWRLRLL